MSQPTYIRIPHPWIRHDLLPIYEWVFPVDPTDEELLSFIEAREEWAKVAQYPVAWLVELSNITKVSPMQRRLFAEHLKRFEAHDVKWTAGVGLIVPNAFIRGLVTAVHWLTPPKYANQAFKRRVDALDWVRARLEERLAAESR